MLVGRECNELFNKNIIVDYYLEEEAVPVGALTALEFYESVMNELQSMNDPLE
ncbi:MAG: hypothetical protein Q4B80_01685 [Aerococcaceae bacterium]|nr:hypothetical protein [Aerococcaceae bacterium]